MSLPATMKAVILKESYRVAVEEVPVPKIKEDGDVLVKVHLAGLCGSDLHFYRGTEGPATGFTLGHELLGEVVETGKGIQRFKKGDLVIAPFSLSCGDCYYCSMGFTSRCDRSISLGCPGTEGAQAEYIRVPLADSSLFHVERDSTIPQDLMLIMTDILPTGYSAAYNARKLLGEEWGAAGADKDGKKGVCVVMGCGPVGLCAITSATTMFSKVFATDLQPSRLALAKRHGATALPLGELKQALAEATDGKGADAVLEVVGVEGAVRTGMELVRPYGVLSSVGVHGNERRLDGDLLYGKNIRMQFGRCSVRTFYPPALEVLRNHLDIFSSFVEHKVGLDQAEEYYKLFEKNLISKTVFVMNQ